MTPKLVVWFNECGKAHHAADPNTLRSPYRKFLCGMRLPKGWKPKPRHEVMSGLVVLECPHCEQARRELTDAWVEGRDLMGEGRGRETEVDSDSLDE